MSEKLRLVNKEKNFQDFLIDLDFRKELLKGIAKLGLIFPSLLQSKGIPHLLGTAPREEEGTPETMNNFTLKYSPNSGIKLTYLLPILQNILNENRANRNILNIIVVPSKSRYRALKSLCENILTFTKDIKIMGEEAIISEGGIKENCNLVIIRPRIFIKYFGGKGGAGVLKSRDVNYVVLDQIETHLSLQLGDYLKEIGSIITQFNELQGKAQTKIILTTKADTENEKYMEIKKYFMKKSTLIKINLQDVTHLSQEEKQEHNYAMLTELEKYILIYSFFKLDVIQGKCLIYCSSIDKAYKLKLFMERFSLQVGVLNGELPLKSQKIIANSFAISQIDRLIIIGESVQKWWLFKYAYNIIYFDPPPHYGYYAILTARAAPHANKILILIDKNNKQDQVKLNILIEKQSTKFGLSYFKELEISNDEFKKFEYRVEDVLSSLGNKTIKRERMNEIKKIMLNSKSMKEYFHNNPKEKKALKSTLKIDRDTHFGHLKKKIPQYLLPDKPLIKSSIDQAISSVNILGKRGESEKSTAADYYADEDPNKIGALALQPTSGRKLWQIRHHKTPSTRYRSNKMKNDQFSI